MCFIGKLQICFELQQQLQVFAIPILNCKIFAPINFYQIIWHEYCWKYIKFAIQQWKRNWSWLFQIWEKCKYLILHVKYKYLQNVLKIMVPVSAKTFWMYTGYLACARCSASGVLVSTEPVSINGSCAQPLQAPSTMRCRNCSGAGKVMCPTCLCTGMVMASEHDPRINPFD